MMAVSDGDFDPYEQKLIAESIDLLRDHFNYKGAIEVDFTDENYDLNSLLDDSDKHILVGLLSAVLLVDDKADYREIMHLKYFIMKMGLDTLAFSELFEDIFNKYHVNPAVYKEYEKYALKNGTDMAEKAFANRKKYLGK